AGQADRDGGRGECGNDGPAVGAEPRRRGRWGRQQQETEHDRDRQCEEGEDARHWSRLPATLWWPLPSDSTQRCCLVVPAGALGGESGQSPLLYSSLLQRSRAGPADQEVNDRASKAHRTSCEAAERPAKDDPP